MVTAKTGAILGLAGITIGLIALNRKPAAPKIPLAPSYTGATRLGEGDAIGTGIPGINTAGGFSPTGSVISPNGVGI